MGPESYPYPPLADDEYPPVGEDMCIWAVYPRLSSLPMIAQGRCETDASARRAVEVVLTGNPRTAAFGVVVTGDGDPLTCQRAAGDGYFWRSVTHDGGPSRMLWPILTIGGRE